MSSRDSRTIGWWSLALGAAYYLSFAAFALWDRFPIAYRDDWDWLWPAVSQPFSWRDLITLHNEHLVPMARLVARADAIRGEPSVALLASVALAAHAVMLALVTREVWRGWPSGSRLRPVAAGAAVACLSFTWQLQSVVFGAAVLFPLVQVGLVAAIVATLEATDAPGAPAGRRWWGAAALAGSCVAVASTTTGLLVPWGAAALAWRRRAAAWIIAGHVVIGLGAAAVYLVQTRVSPAPDAPVWHPPGFIEMAGFVAASFSLAAGFVHPLAGVGLGLLVLGAGAVWTWRALRASDPPTRVQWLAISLAVFGLLSAVAAAPGRAEYGLAQSVQSRYASYALGTLTGVLLLGLARAERLPARRHALVAGLVTAGLLVWLVPQIYLGLVWRAKADLVRVAGLTIATGVPAPEWRLVLHPDPARIDRVMARLSRPQAPWPEMGRRVGVMAGVASCGGEARLERFTTRGEFALIATAGAGRRAIVSDRDGVVVGLAHAMPWSATPEAAPADVARQVVLRLRDWSAPVAWRGFAQPGAGGPYHVAVLDARGTPACTLSAVTVPRVEGHVDLVTVDPGGRVTGAGWAAACGERITRVEVLVDNRPVPAVVTPGPPRPDVEGYLEARCRAVDPPALTFAVEQADWPPGRHAVAWRVSTESGAVAVTQAREFAR